MRRVIPKYKEQTVDVNSIEDCKWIGIEYEYADSGVERLCVVKFPKGYSALQASAVDLVYTIEEGLLKTKKEVVESYLDIGADVFVFNSPDELKEWMLKIRRFKAVRNELGDDDGLYAVEIVVLDKYGEELESADDWYSYDSEEEAQRFIEGFNLGIAINK